MTMVTTVTPHPPINDTAPHTATNGISSERSTAGNSVGTTMTTAQLETNVVWLNQTVSTMETTMSTMETVLFLMARQMNINIDDIRQNASATTPDNHGGGGESE